MGNMTTNFSRFEFACRCGCGYDNINPDLVAALQELRDKVGQALHVNSGCRCEEHNHNVGGARLSQHVAGNAADISSRWLTPRELKKYALQVEAFRQGGIGLYPGFLHVDVGPKRRW